MINQKRLVKTFIDLVKIDSPSGEEEKIGKVIAKRLKGLGGKVIIDSFGNVIGKFPGTGQPIMLSAHMDTVEPGRGIRPKIKGDKITSSGKTVLGGDPKAGIAAILEALTSLKEDGSIHLPIEVVFTREEETSLAGAKNLDYTQISAKWGFTFDGEQEVYRIDVSSPTYHRVDVTILGKSAHSGLEPEKGLSAIEIAARILVELKVGRIDSETTANIGLIEGGSVRNAVAERVQFKGEIRGRNAKSLALHIAHFQEVIAKIAKQYPKATIETIIEKEIDGYVLLDTHLSLIHAVRTLKLLKLNPIFNHSGGLTDVNVFHIHGIEALVVGIGDYLPHTTREYVLISQMTQAARFCERALQNI